MKHKANPWIQGLATYEPGRPIEEVARELGFASADEIIKIASNENALGPSPRAVDAMRQATGRMHLYPDGDCFYLRRKLAERLRVHMDEILISNGSNEAIELLAHVFLGPGRNIVMSAGAFIIYKLVASAEQAGTIMVPMRDFTHDLPAMLAAITPETQLVFIANPNNPTGTMVGQREIDAFMEKVPDHVVVVFDEAYIELLPPNEQPDVLKYVRAGRHVFVLRTFSKTYGLAGLRVGYAVAPKEGIALLHRVRQPFNVNAMAQVAALAALDDDEFVEQTRRMVADGLRCLEHSFRQMKLEYVPSVANFILVKVGRGREVFQELMKRKVIVRPMDGYGLPDHIRVTVGLRHENERFIAALKDVLARRA